MGTTRPLESQVVRVTTSWRSIDEFVAAFAAVADEQSIVVTPDRELGPGTRRRFRIELADGSPALCGEAELVVMARSRVRLRFVVLDASSHDVHGKMLQRANPHRRPAPRMLARIPLARVSDRIARLARGGSGAR